MRFYNHYYKKPKFIEHKFGFFNKQYFYAYKLKYQIIYFAWFYPNPR